ncbi:hypothetical protein TRVA0_001S02234 [Trichomonascus vanleenenianus]|uniref:uncharacterized protein n=1 Tax=Trichomonascus vanleenenianus TaxID=2268995 RepID=UPI003ECB4B0A
MADSTTVSLVSLHGLSKPLVLVASTQLVVIVLLVRWWYLQTAASAKLPKNKPAEARKPQQETSGRQTVEQLMRLRRRSDTPVRLEPTSTLDVVLSLILRANAQVTISKIGKTRFNDHEDLCIELVELERSVQDELTASGAVPLALSLIQLRGILRGYAGSPQESRIMALCSSILKDPRLYAQMARAEDAILEFVTDVTFFNGQVESYSLQAFQSLLSLLQVKPQDTPKHVVSRYECALSILLAYTYSPETTTALTAYLCSRLGLEIAAAASGGKITPRQRTLIKLFLVSTVKPNLRSEDHKHIQALLTSSLKNSPPRSQLFNTMAFLYWQYQRVYAAQSTILKCEVPESVLAQLTTKHTADFHLQSCF